MTFCQKNAYNDELVVQYKGPREEPIPPELDLGDLCPITFSHFDQFCLPQRKLAAEHREYEMSFTDLSYYYGTTQIYPRFYAQLGALNDSACWEATQFYFYSLLLLLFSNK